MFLFLFIGAQQIPSPHSSGVARQSGFASQSAVERHSSFIAAHRTSLEMQQPISASSQLPLKMLLETSQSAWAEHEPPNASHWDVFVMGIIRGGCGRPVGIYISQL